MNVRSETILFDQTVPAGTSNLDIERDLRARGRITEMTIVFYPGQQKTLQVTPFLYRRPDIVVPLTKYAGSRAYFSGDDSKFEIAMNLPFLRDDRLAVRVSNASAYDYDLYVLFELELGG